MYKQINNKIYEIADIGETITEVDAEGKETETKYPLYVIKAEYPSQEFLSNLQYDIDQAKGTMDEAIKKYNDLVAKLLEIKADLPEAPLPEATTAELK